MTIYDGDEQRASDERRRRAKSEPQQRSRTDSPNVGRPQSPTLDHFWATWLCRWQIEPCHNVSENYIISDERMLLVILFQLILHCFLLPIGKGNLVQKAIFSYGYIGLLLALYTLLTLCTYPTVFIIEFFLRSSSNGMIN